jgi:hypothetical protein
MTRRPERVGAVAVGRSGWPTWWASGPWVNAVSRPPAAAPLEPNGTPSS